MASRMVLFTCALWAVFSVVSCQTVSILPEQFEKFKQYLTNSSCKYPDKDAYTPNRLSPEFLRPCYTDDAVDAENWEYKILLCNKFFDVAKGICYEMNRNEELVDALSPYALSELIFNPQWDVCEEAAKIPFLHFMNEKEGICQRQCVGNAELQETRFCRYFVATVTKYMQASSAPKEKPASEVNPGTGTQTPGLNDKPVGETDAGSNLKQTGPVEGTQKINSSQTDYQSVPGSVGKNQPGPYAANPNTAGNGQQGQSTNPLAPDNVGSRAQGEGPAQSGTDFQRSQAETGTGTQEGQAGTETYHSGTGAQEGQGGIGTYQPRTGTQGGQVGTGRYQSGTQGGQTGTGESGTGTQGGQVGTGTDQSESGTQGGQTGTGESGTGTQGGQVGTGRYQSGTQGGQTGTGESGTITQGGQVGTGTDQSESGTQGGQTRTGQSGTGVQGGPEGSGTGESGTGTQVGQAGTDQSATGTQGGQVGTGQSAPGTLEGQVGNGQSVPGIQEGQVGTNQSGAGTQGGQVGTGTGQSAPGTQEGQVGTGQSGAGTQGGQVGTGTGQSAPGTQEGQVGTGQSGAGTQGGQVGARGGQEESGTYQSAAGTQGVQAGTDILTGQSGAVGTNTSPWGSTSTLESLASDDDDDEEDDDDWKTGPLNMAETAGDAQGNAPDKQQSFVKVPASSYGKGKTYYGEEPPPSGHFMAYFVTAVVLCISGYVIYHNKQKILAFVLEGRRDGQRRRAASGGAKYTKLQPSVEEVMPSLEKSTTSKNYIY